MATPGGCLILRADWGDPPFILTNQKMMLGVAIGETLWERVD